ncbi:hypothetical protein N7492_000342 [Penicillium capsulatum]|uniref:Protein kinase domain-containing protein n=1 Tax=Penicillium capsulatum TaxID=69766 RepID=A0A9W9LYG2_9EURO|nr:hypothetical protein N7492_000342 [Penicillium capsulatum]KAJ6130594.1 hypothetical protein N7512_003374 [Penicillium capsulatum]
MSTMECIKDNFVEGRLLDGRFRTVAPLNHGSFGMVFLATDTMTGHDVAIKCLAKTSSMDPSTAVDDRFEELECHRRLGYHPNLVNLIHSFDTETHTYLVLEYCVNGDLYEAIRLNRGPLETEHVRDFMLQLVSAVEFMHSNGLYHRDIKPENIFLMQDGSMKLGDFGLVCRDAWSHDACVGSDRYMAPEQYEPTAAGYSPAKADIWSVGICLLNILFARNPFVTPTESDVLFADYVRDRQSLFDIFPNMSQDTFEILTHALPLDPERRSLSAVRECILRTISFTTDDESLDEFCTEDREMVPASANREPLRTPSIQSPHINQGDSFPWAKALQSSPPQAVRQLSAIPDNESYSEDLFPPSEAAGTSWFSTHETPSMASVLDSAMSDSFRSFNLSSLNLKQKPPLPRSDPVPITGSLPSHASKPLPSLSMVFGKNANDQISKSWSDMWDEEESENEDLALQQRREQNSRSWSQESQDHRPSGLAEVREQASALSTVQTHTPDTLSTLPTAPRAIRAKSLDADSDSGTSNSTPRPAQPSSPKKSTLDKWAKLGDKRRNCKTRDLFGPQRAANTWRRDWGLGSSGFDHGARAKQEYPKQEAHSPGRRRRVFLEKDWRREAGEVPKMSPVKHAYDGSVDEDLDLVGGWHDLHL